MKNILLLICILISIQSFAQTSLTGKVTDGEIGEPILFGTVSLYKDDLLITGTDTDLDGFYNFANIDAGTYDVKVTYVGYSPTRITDVIVTRRKSNKLDIELGQGANLEDVVIIEYKVPLVRSNQTSCCGLTTEQLKRFRLSLQASRFFNPPIPSPVKKLPARELSHTVQNMLDFHIY